MKHITNNKEVLIMMMCNECFSVVKESELPYMSNKCPVQKCNGELFDIDELMIPAISVLNKKGYKTTYCCAGHYCENEECGMYVGMITDTNLPKLPNGFSIEKGNLTDNHFVIRLNFLPCDMKVEEKYLINYQKNAEFLNWCINLPVSPTSINKHEKNNTTSYPIFTMDLYRPFQLFNPLYISSNTYNDNTGDIAFNHNYKFHELIFIGSNDKATYSKIISYKKDIKNQPTLNNMHSIVNKNGQILLTSTSLPKLHSTLLKLFSDLGSMNPTSLSYLLAKMISEKQAEICINKSIKLNCYYNTFELV